MSSKDDHKTRTKEMTLGLHKKDEGVKLGGEWKFSVNPPFLKERVEYFDKLLKQ